MLRYPLGRIAATIPVVVLISLLVFLLIHAAPGIQPIFCCRTRPRRTTSPKHGTQWASTSRSTFNISDFWRNLVRRSWNSFRYSDPVIGLIGERLPATVELAIASMLISLLAGIPLGVWAGAEPNSSTDDLGSTFGFFGVSMPSFWLGIMLILIVSGHFNWLPSLGRNTYGVAQGADSAFTSLRACSRATSKRRGTALNISSCRRSHSAPA